MESNGVSRLAAGGGSAIAMAAALAAFASLWTSGCGERTSVDAAPPAAIAVAAFDVESVTLRTTITSKEETTT